MNKYISLTSSVLIMLCLGSIYAWSIFVPELRLVYNYSSLQTQVIFGFLISSFTLTMIFADKLKDKINIKILGLISAVFFSSGYIVASYAKGNFFIIFFGISILAGIGTGLGYFISITTPIKQFENKKGLVTGIVTASFGLGSVFLIYVVRIMILPGASLSEFFLRFALIYGFVIAISSAFIPSLGKTQKLEKLKKIFFDIKFIRLFFGIFCGTFSGLMVIANLKPIGLFSGLSYEPVIFGVAAFSLANFIGRLFWGWISDMISGRKGVFLALLLQSASVLFIASSKTTEWSYLIISMLIGFSFGANFVLFTRETAQTYGVESVGRIYPYVFLGYGLAGIFGPFTGGVLFDFFKTYSYSTYLASLISLTGAAVFLCSARE